MNSNKKIATIAGILFLTAIVASLLGGGILESILNAPNYLNNISANKIQVIIGVSLELVNGIAVMCIAVMLFSILKQHNESLALGYVGFRIIESILCIISAITPLLLLMLSQEYLKTETSDDSYLQSLGILLKTLRSDLAEILIPLFFSLGALLFYYLLYTAKLIPRFISVWGFIGAVFVFVLIFLEADIIINLILVLPIILNEIFLGIWLILKGFNPSSITSLSHKQI
jgi:hypothetical protein